MSTGFGFYVRDFPAVFSLVHTVTSVLRVNSSCSTQFPELIAQLILLEVAFQQVRGLEVVGGLERERIALRQAAAQCQWSIKTFCFRITGTQNQPSFWGEPRDAWMKVKWAVCEKDDVAMFKASLVGYTEAIQLLLTTIQMKSAFLREKKDDERQITLAARIREGYLECVERLGTLTNQGKQLYELTTTTMNIGIKVFHLVLQLQELISRIPPPQIDRRQPVYVVDTLGRSNLFHLGFIKSANALCAVLNINFERCGHGANMIERGKFAIQDTVYDIVLSKDWDTCFRPGQFVYFSMTFTQGDSVDNLFSCPKCKNMVGCSAHADIECPDCGTIYMQLFEFLPPSAVARQVLMRNSGISVEDSPQPLAMSIPPRRNYYASH